MALNRNRLLADNIVRAWDQGETGFYIESSGSTGLPKKLFLSRDKIVWSCKITGNALNITAGDSIYCCLPVTRIGGFMQIARSLVWNIPVNVVEPTANPLLHYSGRTTIISLTPQQLYEVLENGETRNVLNSFRIVLIGGAQIDNQLEMKTQGMKPIFYHTYGMTETYSHIALRQLNRDFGFIPLPQTEIKLNALGCLCIRNFITDNGWLETNDLAEIYGGFFRTNGRTDNVINSGGIKTSAEEIEKLLQSQLNLGEGAIFYAGLPDERLGQKPVLVVNRKKVPQLPPWEHLFANLPYAKPREIIYKEDFVYTDTGKIQRQKSLKQNQ